MSHRGESLPCSIKTYFQILAAYIPYRSLRREMATYQPGFFFHRCRDYVMTCTVLTITLTNAHEPPTRTSPGAMISMQCLAFSNGSSSMGTMSDKPGPGGVVDKAYGSNTWKLESNRTSFQETAFNTTIHSICLNISGR